MKTYFKRRKFGNTPKQYKGSIYHSTLEANYAAYLDMMKKAQNPRDRVVKWDRQVKVDLSVNGVHITNYFMDFVVSFADGREEWVEVKGAETDVWKLKEKLFRAIYPERLYVIIKARDYKNLIA